MDNLTDWPQMTLLTVNKWKPSKITYSNVTLNPTNFILIAPPCSAGLDIGIVLDKSRSVNIRNLKKIIASLAELVDRFEPGPDKDHFGLVTFNRRAYTEFTFSDETLYRKETLKKKISEIPLTLALQTRTDLAMKEARDNLFSPSGGDRPEKPNIMIFLTDGRPTNQPRDFATFAAEFYKDSKVLIAWIYVLGLELTQIQIQIQNQFNFLIFTIQGILDTIYR